MFGNVQVAGSLIDPADGFLFGERFLFGRLVSHFSDVAALSKVRSRAPATRCGVSAAHSGL